MEWKAASKDWRAGLEAPEPLEAKGRFVFLCHALDVTLSEEQLVGARLGSNAREPPGIGSLGLVFLRSGLGWHRWLGWSQGPGLEVP